MTAKEGLWFVCVLVVLRLNRIGNHYYKAPITVAAELLLSKLDLHCTALTQLKGAICSSTHSLMFFIKIVERLKECFITIILPLVVEILY